MSKLRTELSTADIEAIVCAIWEAMFGPALPVTPGGEASAVDVVTSLVSVGGDWQGAVVTHVPTTLGIRLTQELIGTQDAPPREQVIDAMGELCNIMAGNIKALRPGLSRLAPPRGSFDSAHDWGMPDVTPTATVPFTCDGQVFAVIVLDQPAEAAR